MPRESSSPARGRSGLFVLGMHRSGTSATAGALQRLGFDLGEELIEAAPDNPKGYFEHAAAVAANESLLDALDRSWDDVRALPGDWTRSDAARAVVPAIAAVLDGFDGRSRWALKDPRLCRTLPLWLEAAAARDLETRCLLVLRHPVEVAASLRARDGMGEETAAMLWLRHVLESLHASATQPRALLTYDALMRDPQAALGDACARLGFDVGDADVRAFVDARDRHHRVEAAGSDAVPASPFMRLAIAAYRAAVDAGDASTAIDKVEDEFERLAARDATWIETLGSAMRIADVRRRGLQARALDAHARADALQKLFDEVSAQSLQRLEALQAHDRRLADTQAALEAAEALSIERMALLGEQDLRLGRTQAALETVEAQSLQRMAEAQALRGQLDATESALALAERLSLERQGELQTLHARLVETQAALAAVETLSRERLAEIERSEAEKVALEALSLERLAEMQRLHAQSERAQAALVEAERLSLDRLAEIETLRAALAARDAEIVDLRKNEAELQALRQSRLFRVRRALRRWLGLDQQART